MDVIAGAIHAKGSASNLPDNASEVGMEILFEFGFDESAALFGAEDEMHEEVRGGIWHRFFRPFEARSSLLPTHGLRRGLYSFRLFAALSVLVDSSGPERTIQRAVLNGFSDVFGFYGGSALQVRNRAGHL
jgi:hypothetical protein